jgi:hypothetical protein
LPFVFPLGTFSYLVGIILNPFNVSLTSPCLSSISYVLTATTTYNGFIFDIFVTIGAKSLLSCLVRASLALTLQLICFRTSAPIYNLAYFFLSFDLLV